MKASDATHRQMAPYSQNNDVNKILMKIFKIRLNFLLTLTFLFNATIYMEDNSLGAKNALVRLKVVRNSEKWPYIL